jgi:Sporulation and spore germination
VGLRAGLNLLQCNLERTLPAVQRRGVALLVAVAGVLLGLTGAASAAPGAACTFRLGFATLHAALPDIVGNCLWDERHDGVTGDGLQPTTRGLLVWRKADNRTAFTDGYVTWLNGPFGVQQRLNSERFAWESGAPSIRVQVFFSHRPESLDNFEAVLPVDRTLTRVGQQVGTAALAALIEGPTPEEQAAGFFSELGGMLGGDSDCDGADFRLTIAAEGQATVRFCHATISAGVGQDARVLAEIQATLRQFPTVERVRLLARDGHCLFDLSGLDRCLGA